MEAVVRASLGRVGYAGEDTHLVVAVSGGPDSVALLNSLVSLQTPLGLRLHVAHLNHDFRGEEAEEDARFVGEMAQSLALPATVEKADPTAYQRERGISSFEEASRQLRYNFLARVAEGHHAAVVALGHTADDQAETVLMHILRGSGLTGLRGMEELTTRRSTEDGNPVVLLRPLLKATKEETLEYCRQRSIPFREDSDNLSPRFTRNRIRHTLMPALSDYNPRIREALLRLAQNANLESRYLEEELNRAWSSVARVDGEQVILDRSSLAELHPFMQSLVLRRAYKELTGDTRRLHYTHLEAMLRHNEAPSGKNLELPKGLRLLATYGELLVFRHPYSPCPYPPILSRHALLLPTPKDSPSKSQKTTDLPGWQIGVQVETPHPEGLDKDPLTGWLDASILDQEAWIRTRLPGDQFQPSGMAGTKKLQDFLVDTKVPQHWRDRIPLVVCQRGIAWVVGYRVAEWAKYNGSGEAIQISFRPKR